MIGASRYVKKRVRDKRKQKRERDSTQFYDLVFTASSALRNFPKRSAVEGS